MATTLTLRDHLLRPLQNATPGTTDPVLDSIGRAIDSGDVDYMGRAVVATLWAIATTYSLGDYVELSTGEVLVCIVGGDSHASAEPTPPGYGATVVDNAATWRQLTG